MIERLFNLKEQGTDIRTEKIAGITIFMTMYYLKLLAGKEEKFTGSYTSSHYYLLPDIYGSNRKGVVLRAQELPLYPDTIQERRFQV